VIYSPSPLVFPAQAVNEVKGASAHFFIYTCVYLPLASFSVCASFLRAMGDIFIPLSRTPFQEWKGAWGYG